MSIRVPDKKLQNHVTLLYLKKEDKEHYAWVKSLNRLPYSPLISRDINFAIAEKNCVRREFNFAKLTVKGLYFFLFYKNCTLINDGAGLRWPILIKISSNIHFCVEFMFTKKFGSPSSRELLRCSHERNDIYDCYALGANKRLRGRLADSIIGHLPREISRATRFFLLRGGMVHL